MSTTCPQIRPEIDAVPTEQGEETIYVLYDRSGLSDAQLAVSPAAMYLAAQFDGQTSILEILDRFAAQSAGTVLSSENIDELLKALNEAFFLQNDDFNEYRTHLRNQFFDEPVRAATSAGSAYSDDASKLPAELEAIIASAPPPEEEGRITNAPRPAPRGVIAPHIDFARGAVSYGQVYRELRTFNPPEAVLILGTSHDMMQNRFALCEKDFAIPTGIVPCARDLVQDIAQRCAPVANFLDDQFTHRSEHSIELQAVWLSHIWGNQVPIIPLLVGSVHEYLQPDVDARLAAEDQQVIAMTDAIRPLLSQKRIMILASADLAHIGPRFDDPREVDAEFLKETEAADRAYLTAVAGGDASAALASLAAHGDGYHVCGTGSIFMLNRLLPEVKGRLLGYHQSNSPEMRQAVSFAGLIFE